jgi:hypothetical protein
MPCGCRTDGGEAEAKVFELLGQSGLREIAEQTLRANQVMGDSIRHLRKAERAAVLGFSPDVVSLHRAAGERANRACRRQFSVVLEAIDERVGRADWAEMAADARREFDARDGAAQLADFAEEFKARLLDVDTFPTSLTGRTGTLLEETVARAGADGVDGSVRLLRERVERAVSDLAAPEMGLQPASPDTAAVLICVGGTLAIMVVALLICASAPFCWCCAAPFIMIACFINIAACSALENVP